MTDLAHETLRTFGLIYASAAWMAFMVGCVVGAALMYGQQQPDGDTE